MGKFESFFNKIIILASFAAIGTPIYLLIMDSWKSALLLFIAYNIAFIFMMLGGWLSKLNKVDIFYFFFFIITLAISITPNIILSIGVCIFLWDTYDGMFMGILFVLNICWSIMTAVGSFGIAITTRDDIKRKQAELAEAKKREQQEIIETAVKNALKDYKNKE